MKTLIASAIISFFTFVSFSSFAASYHSNPGNSTETSKVYVQALNTGKVDVTVVKRAGENLAIEVLDKEGHVLVNKTLEKDESLSRTRFDLNQLPDGTYQIVVGEGTSKQIKEIVIDTTVSASFRTVHLG